MRKCIGLVLFAVTLFCANQVFAYTIDDPINNVWPGYGNPDAYDRIGGRRFEIYGINISQDANNLTFDIFTNYPQAGFNVSTWHTFSGDLALDTTGQYQFDYGVALTSHDGLAAGTLYRNAKWHISDEYDPGGYIFHEGKIVTLKDGDVAGQGNVQWIALAGGPDYKIHVTIPNINGYLPDFQHTYYASANCANDFVGAPEPVSTVLFLLGGATLAVRRLRKGRKA